uniref:Membrane magnesium transporter 1 n=1 Tax=Gallus gallus TaxID=9031 RepID=A0A8V0YIJ0_CHICK
PRPPVTPSSRARWGRPWRRRGGQDGGCLAVEGAGGARPLRFGPRGLLGGAASLLHAADREGGRDASHRFLQTLLAFAVTCYGIVHIAGEFKDMDATSELKNKTFDTLRNHPSFYVFNHRGRVLFQSPDTANSSSNQDALSSSSSLKFRKLEPLRR